MPYIPLYWIQSGPNETMNQFHEKPEEPENLEKPALYLHFNAERVCTNMD